MTFGQMMFRENDIRLNDDSWKWRLAERWFRKMAFGGTTIRKNVVRDYEVSLIRRYGHVTIRSNDFRQFFFGKIAFWFDEMTFRENDVSPDWTNSFTIIALKFFKNGFFLNVRRCWKKFKCIQKV